MSNREDFEKALKDLELEEIRATGSLNKDIANAIKKTARQYWVYFSTDINELEEENDRLMRITGELRE